MKYTKQELNNLILSRVIKKHSLRIAENIDSDYAKDIINNQELVQKLSNKIRELNNKDEDLIINALNIYT